MNRYTEWEIFAATTHGISEVLTNGLRSKRAPSRRTRNLIMFDPLDIDLLTQNNNHSDFDKYDVSR